MPGEGYFLVDNGKYRMKIIEKNVNVTVLMIETV